MAENKENIPKERFVPGALRRMNAAIGPEGFNLTPYDNSIIELKELFQTEIKNLKDLIIRQNEFITNILGEHSVLLKEMRKQTKITKETQKKFPIKSIEELNKINEEINDDSEENFVITIKGIIKPGDITKCLEKILSEELILSHNYDGIHGKAAFKEYKKLNSVLFRSMQTDGFTEREYIEKIRKAFKTFKNKYFKNKCVQQKKNANE